MSRRDDLEAVGYVLIYLIRGSLPWQNYNIPSKSARYEKIKEKKVNISLEELCQDCPQEIKAFMKYCRELKFEQDPDYSQMKKLFVQMADRLGFDLFDNLWDWAVKGEAIRSHPEFLDATNSEGCLFQ